MAARETARVELGPIASTSPMPPQPPAENLTAATYGAKAKVDGGVGAQRSLVPAFISGSVGVAALAMAGAFWALRGNTIAEVLASCTKPAQDANCDPSLQSTADRGRTYTAVSGALFGVGVAGVVGAGLLSIWRPTELDLHMPLAAGTRLISSFAPSGVVLRALY